MTSSTILILEPNEDHPLIASRELSDPCHITPLCAFKEPVSVLEMEADRY
jgi:hypothetical protein